MVQTVREVMTVAPITLPTDAPLVEAARLMRDRDIVVRGMAEGGDPNEMRVGQVVSGDLVSVAPDDPVERAIQLMREKAIRRLPVLEEGKPVGVITIGDLAVERDAESVLADISEEPPTR